MIEEARRLILKENRPMKRGELVRQLEARGFKIAGTDKNKVFGTTVWSPANSIRSRVEVTGRKEFRYPRTCCESAGT